MVPDESGKNGDRLVTEPDVAAETQTEEAVGNDKAPKSESSAALGEGLTASGVRHLLSRLESQLSRLESPRTVPLLTALLVIGSLTTAAVTLYINLFINPKMPEIALGQLYQGGYSTRIGVTTIWKDAYTADTRNRVSKFTVYYKRWESKDRALAKESADILANQYRIFDGKVIRENQNLLQLLDSDLEEKWRTLQSQGRPRPVKKGGNEGEKWGDLSDDDFVEAALKYRNAVIECLNALEAIQAIIKNRPTGEATKPDNLEPRYQDLINDLSEKLQPFVCRYNEANPRPTAPWNNLIDRKRCIPLSSL